VTAPKAWGLLRTIPGTKKGTLLKDIIGVATTLNANGSSPGAAWRAMPGTNQVTEPITIRLTA